MKKLVIPMLALMASGALAAQRSVVVEEFSSWTCPYCPYAIQAVDSLKKVFGDTVTVMTYISSYCGNAQTRFSYYAIYYVPTCWFDGLVADTGGYTGNFNDYKAHVNARKNIASPVSVDNVIATVEWDTIRVSGTVNIEQNINSGNSPKIFCLVTERNVQANSNGTRADYFVRGMLSSPSGDAITVYTSGEHQDFSYKLAAGAAWNKDSLDIAIWVQYYSTKEVLQGDQTHMTNLGTQESGATPELSLSFRNNGLCFTLPAAGEVSLALYDVSGRQVASLAEGSYAAGEHPVSMPSLEHGVYTAVLCTDFGTTTLKMVR